MEALRAETERQRTELRKEEEGALIQPLAATNELSSVLLSKHATLVYDRNYGAEVRRYLNELNVSGEDIERVWDLLRRYQSPRSVFPSQAREKTDPLRRSVEVIGELAADALK